MTACSPRYLPDISMHDNGDAVRVSRASGVGTDIADGESARFIFEHASVSIVSRDLSVAVSGSGEITIGAYAKPKDKRPFATGTFT